MTEFCGPQRLSKLACALERFDLAVVSTTMRTSDKLHRSKGI